MLRRQLFGSGRGVVESLQKQINGGAFGAVLRVALADF